MATPTASEITDPNTVTATTVIVPAVPVHQ
jgi:hypothetical protein